MSAPHTLLIPLIGPMQSWGYRSRFDDRDTALEPTRSGVLGMLCAALGWSREQDLTPFATLRMGVRIDAPGRVMTDYHTAQEVLRAGGGIAPTVQSRRRYLADARFLVGLEGEDVAFLGQLERRLREPVWTLYLGRKSFPLSEPPYLPDGSLFAGRLEEAFAHVSWLAQRRRQSQSEPLRCMIESATGEIVQMDAPRNFASRQFDLRRVTQNQVRVQDLPSCGSEGKPCISHD